MKNKTLWLISVICFLSVVMLAKGCNQNEPPTNPTIPAGSQPQRVILRIGSAPSNPAAKATRLRIDAVGLNDQLQEVGPRIDPVIIERPEFPCQAEIVLYRPPCRYKLTITAGLSRDADRTWTDVIDLCTQQSDGMTIDVFENMHAEALTISAPDSAPAGQPVAVRCEVRGLSAPDSVPTLTLSEQGGQSLTPTQNQTGISGDFPDPYPLTSPQTQRIFTCQLTDGKSPAQTTERIVARIVFTPVPTATPAPGVPTPTPTNTPVGPTATPTATPTVTPTPTPDPCIVTTTTDSGAGSLRQMLADAATNGCTTITFAPAIQGQIITLTNGQLMLPDMTLTLDGGSGVTISGNNATRVFYGGNGINVTFQHLTITNGNSNNGGGIFIEGGTVTIGNGGTVTNNTVLYEGGGIYNLDGTLTITNGGTVSSNTANDDGGGIFNDGGLATIIVSNGGTVRGNTAPGEGGGIYNFQGQVTIGDGGIVEQNTGHRGGGIYNHPYAGYGEIIVEDGGIVRNNEANPGPCGGIQSGGGGNLIIRGTISNNTAQSNGGGICNYNGNASVESSGRIVNNIATTGVGGGIHFDTGTLSVNGCLISGNTATNGGGIYQQNGTITGTPNYGSGNTPNNCVGGGCP